MDTDAKGQLGGLEADDDARRKMAKRSPEYTCPSCQKSNRAIMEERAQEVKKLAEEGKETKEEQVPEELRLAYKDELKTEKKGEEADDATPKSNLQPSKEAERIDPAAEPRPSTVGDSPQTVVVPTVQQPPLRRAGAGNSNEMWIDMAIYAIAALLVLLVARKALSYL